jgi:hypothetical protein
VKNAIQWRNALRFSAYAVLYGQYQWAIFCTTRSTRGPGTEVGIVAGVGRKSGAYSAVYNRPFLGKLQIGIIAIRFGTFRSFAAAALIRRAQKIRWRNALRFSAYAVLLTPGKFGG